MKRASGIIIGILLGALATGIGVGSFLKKANDDREQLAAQLAATSKQATDARRQSQQAIEDANAKLNTASVEVAKAQNLIKSLAEERDLMAAALPLAPPSAALIRGWSDVVALGLGVSLKIPNDSEVSSNDAKALTIVQKNATVGEDWRWFSLSPYDARLEQELTTALATSTPVAYAVNGHLLLGMRGSLPGKKTQIFVLRIRSLGQITHLLWLKEHATVLATLRFER